MKISDVEKRLVKYILAQRKTLIAGLLCAAVVSGISLYVAKLVKETLDAIDNSTGANIVDRIQSLNKIAIAVLIIFAVKYIFTFGQTYMLGLTANRVAATLRNNIFEHIHKMPLGFFHTRRTGWFQSIISNDINVIQTGTTSIRDFVDAPIRVFGGLIYMFFINWKLALIVVALMPFVAYIINRIGKRVKVISGQVQTKLADLSTVVEETVSGVRVVKAFTQEENEIERFRAENTKTLNTIMRAVRRMAQLRPSTELIGAVALMFVLWFGGRMVLGNSITIGDLMAFILLLDQIANASSHVGYVNNIRHQVSAAATRIFEDLLDQSSDIQDSPNAVEIGRVKGEIVFDNVSFAYADGTPALKNVNLTVHAGEWIALVGLSGAGKSTLADLLMRFYDPTEGAVLVDGIDIRNVTLKSLRSQIGVVPQQTALFARSIKDNILYGKPSGTMDEVIAAAMKANAHDFIMDKEEGYDTILGERGAKLSGGQAQRISIARALIKDPPIMIFDEATSSLDAVSERAIQQAMEETTQNRTTIMIAHRLSAAKRADRIFVMQYGQIVESGSHDELMSLDGSYATMYRAFESGVLTEV